jgi:hypothetical protein
MTAMQECSDTTIHGQMLSLLELKMKRERDLARAKYLSNVILGE